MSPNTQSGKKKVVEMFSAGRSMNQIAEYFECDVRDVESVIRLKFVKYKSEAEDLDVPLVKSSIQRAIEDAQTSPEEWGKKFAKEQEKREKKMAYDAQYHSTRYKAKC